MRHLAKPRDASFFRVFFNPYRYGVLTIIAYNLRLPFSYILRLPSTYGVLTFNF